MKSNLITFAWSSLLIIVLAPVAIYGHELKLVTAGISYCFFTIWRFKESNSSKSATIMFITLPLLLLFMPMYFFINEPPLTSLPSTSFHFIGILFGSIIFFLKKLCKYMAFTDKSREKL